MRRTDTFTKSFHKIAYLNQNLIKVKDQIHTEQDKVYNGPRDILFNEN